MSNVERESELVRVTPEVSNSTFDQEYQQLSVETLDVARD